MEKPSTVVQYASTQSCIPYKKDFRKITDSVTGAILLQQMMFRAQHMNWQPFYKFKEPCAHEQYHDGDSWTEELGFSRREFDSALERIATKTTRANKDSLLASLPDNQSTSLVVYWTDMNRLTWYQINVRALNVLFEQTFGTPQKQEESATCPQETSDSAAPCNGEFTLHGKLDPATRLLTEKTTENTRDYLLTPKVEKPHQQHIRTPKKNLDLPLDPLIPARNESDVMPDVQSFVQLYNDQRPVECPRVMCITKKRHDIYSKYLQLFPSIQFWDTVFSELHFSDWAKGKESRNGYPMIRRDLDWLCQVGHDGVENCLKVYEKQYRNRTAITGEDWSVYEQEEPTELQ